MLSGILNNDRAISLNIAIMRAFIFVREFALRNKTLAEKIAKLEREYIKQIKDIYEAMHYLIREKRKLFDFEKRQRKGYKK